MSHVLIPSIMVPTFNVARAFKHGVQKEILMTTWGGLGDQVCAEPVLRYALKTFKNRNIHLATETPDLFSHLKFASVTSYAAAAVDPNLREKYAVLETILPPSHFLAEYISHAITNAVDFASICALRMQLPIAEKHIELPDYQPDIRHDWDRTVVLHCGRHWPSKTFPVEWWQAVIDGLIDEGLTPLLIGRDTDDNRGTVDVDASRCLDLRNKTSIEELIFLCKATKCLLTNDSSPLHIAAAGKAHIGFVASCKHADFIMHWRRNEQGVNEWGWRMRDFSRDGVWNHVDFNPVQITGVEVKDLQDGLMEALLPPPNDLVQYARSCLL